MLVNAPHWRKASYSGTETNCVEVRADLAAIRDSKDRGGPALRFEGDALRRFVAAARAS
ncbi:DUF397 domain-containing protein [Saccharothrix sp. HUAS TT1]|uniref:DUF397 domain-containing protein n=1 Tax=Saccharothrix sp. HUAS TT1 TaxID=3231910 RepID=UPI00345C6058